MVTAILTSGVNGHEKQVHGKGVRAFQNTIMALALLEFLSEQGKYSPSADSRFADSIFGRELGRQDARHDEDGTFQIFAGTLDLWVGHHH